jgi:hypothetical protein
VSARKPRTHVREGRAQKERGLRQTDPRSPFVATPAKPMHPPTSRAVEDELAQLRADVERLSLQRFQQRHRADGAEDDANRLAKGLEDIAAGHPDPVVRALEALRTDDLFGYRHELRAARIVCRHLADMLLKGRGPVDGEVAEAVLEWLRVAGRNDRPLSIDLSRYDHEETSRASR